MEAKSINLNGKNAKYYEIKNPSATTDTNLAAHFYGGNGFALGVYEPLLTDLAKNLNITEPI